jgi:hypothetical protein
MSDEPKSARSWGWVGWTPLAAFVLYPLSVRPALWMVLKTDHDSAKQIYEAVYAPLEWASERNDTIARMVRSYCNWWTPEL